MRNGWNERSTPWLKQSDSTVENKTTIIIKLESKSKINKTQQNSSSSLTRDLTSRKGKSFIN
jgi:hypothetical protein